MRKGNWMAFVCVVTAARLPLGCEIDRGRKDVEVPIAVNLNACSIEGIGLGGTRADLDGEWGPPDYLYDRYVGANGEYEEKAEYKRKGIIVGTADATIRTIVIDLEREHYRGKRVPRLSNIIQLGASPEEVEKILGRPDGKTKADTADYLYRSGPCCVLVQFHNGAGKPAQEGLGALFVLMFASDLSKDSTLLDSDTVSWCREETTMNEAPLEKP